MSLENITARLYHVAMSLFQSASGLQMFVDPQFPTLRKWFEISHHCIAVYFPINYVVYQLLEDCDTAQPREHLSIWWCTWSRDPYNEICTYRQILNMRHTLVGNEIVYHSDVVGASPVGAAPTTSSLSTWLQYISCVCVCMCVVHMWVS